MTKKSEKSLENNTATCKWCSKTFKTERTLAAHMCVKKKRWADRDLTHVRLALRTFQIFYERTTTSRKIKTAEDFIRSQYYADFVKFGRACMLNEYLNPEAFAEWLINTGVKLSDWAKDSTYDRYLLDYVKKEPGLKALERTILYLAAWSQESNLDWQDYFRSVSENRAVYDIRSAKISPWVVYLSSSGGDLLTRLNDEQVRMINHIIDAGFWMEVFKRNATEVSEVQDACEAAGI
jgi:hypothetical protein